MIYYLAQKYSGNESQAFFEAIRDSAKLRQKNYIVFSPIMHNHQFDVEIYKGNRWTLMQPSGKEDYYEWDLALCAGMLKNDGMRCSRDGCDESRNYQCDQCEYRRLFDSGLTMLFAPSCFIHQKYIAWTLNDEDFINWDSKGAKMEYGWAKQHHVRCLLLEPFLEGKEVEI